MQTENQIKAEASRLFLMAKAATSPEHQKHFLYARWALLAVLNEKQELSYFIEFDNINGTEVLAGSGAVTGQIAHYEALRSGEYPHMKASDSDRRLDRWVDRQTAPPAP